MDGSFEAWHNLSDTLLNLCPLEVNLESLEGLD